MSETPEANIKRVGDLLRQYGIVSTRDDTELRAAMARLLRQQRSARDKAQAERAKGGS